MLKIFIYKNFNIFVYLFWGIFVLFVVLSDECGKFDEIFCFLFIEGVDRVVFFFVVWKFFWLEGSVFYCLECDNCIILVWYLFVFCCCIGDCFVVYISVVFFLNFWGEEKVVKCVWGFLFGWWCRLFWLFCRFNFGCLVGVGGYNVNFCSGNEL